MRPSTLELERWNTSASIIALCLGVRVAGGAKALGALFALSREALPRLARDFHFLRGRRKTRGYLGRAAETSLPRVHAVMLRGSCTWVSCSFRHRHGLGGGMLFDGHQCRDRLAQLMLYLEEVWRVMPPDVGFDIRQVPWRFVTGRLDDIALEKRQGTCHLYTPGVLILCLCGVL